VRKPREPREKEATGGTTRWNNQEEYSTVPSPPSYRQIMELDWIYSYDEIEKMWVTKTQLGCPELHAGSKYWVLLL
jgi:hypothetical protein